ncbi:DUF3310 domain-containing protein [Holdemanella porci]|uniref:DUF3310 domain-containing protein n=1 Tax=Holdemanella porci TaxID=2652276 RepID=UPI001D150D86|nr:DUF3310 domain-containing protein [Holdemanella porci]MCC3361516.1 DUF3310 domain-containing protein [Holdemanella porci]
MVKEKDAVNHPEHYESGSYECIDEMIAVFGMSVVANFCLCNVWKYRYRALNKNGKEDMEKSDWYMCKYMELKKTMSAAYED